MRASAKLRFIRLSPQKGRLVADQIRGLSVEKAVELLRFSSKKASTIVRKVLESATANAEHNEGADVDELFVSSIYIDEGPRHKRFKARARGRMNHIVKPTSHITVVVSDLNS